MHSLESYLTTRLPWITLLVSASLILGAHGFESIGGLEPCPLCIEQRGWHWLMIWISVLGLLNAGPLNQRFPTLAIFGLLSLTAFASTVRSGFHAGVEYKWWAGPASCAGGGASLSMQDMLGALGQATDAPACDDIPWSLFGISMAGYNFLISFVLLGLCTYATLRLRKTSNHD